MEVFGLLDRNLLSWSLSRGPNRLPPLLRILLCEHSSFGRCGIFTFAEWSHSAGSRIQRCCRCQCNIDGFLPIQPRRLDDGVFRPPNSSEVVAIVFYCA